MSFPDARTYKPKRRASVYDILPSSRVWKTAAGELGLQAWLGINYAFGNTEKLAKCGTSNWLLQRPGKGSDTSSP